MSWHANPELVAQYSESRLTSVEAASFEAHILQCADCRAGLSVALARRQQHRLQVVWREVERAADAPRLGLLERVLSRAGVPEHIGRLVAATPSLSASWLLAVAATLVFAVAAARAGAGEVGLVLFLLLAPLLPVAGTAAAFGPRLDPAHEISVAAPTHGFRLLLIRSLTVLVTTTLMAAAASTAMPHSAWAVAAWVLPSLALTTATLLVATWFAPISSAACVTAAWVLLVVGSALRAEGRTLTSDITADIAAFGATAQVLFALFALVAAAVLVRRRNTFEPGRLP